MGEAIKSQVPAAQSATKLVSVYVKMRDDLGEKEKQFKEFKSKRQAEMLQIANAIQKIMDESGDIESLKTVAGTAFRATKDFASVTDWNAVLTSVVSQIIREVQADENHGVSLDHVVSSVLDSGTMALFNKAVNKTVVKDYMNDHGGETPPGVTYGTKVEIQIRRA